MAEVAWLRPGHISSDGRRQHRRERVRDKARAVRLNDLREGILLEKYNYMKGNNGFGKVLNSKREWRQ
jgi:hypothetical protein